MEICPNCIEIAVLLKIYNILQLYLELLKEVAFALRGMISQELQTFDFFSTHFCKGINIFFHSIFQKIPK